MKDENPTTDMDKLKEFLGKLTSKTKKLIIIGVVGVIAFAVIVAVVLNNRPFAVLFSDVSAEEAQQIIGKLQESEINYQYKNNDILVKEDILEKTKADLVSEGYPQSGFTYDVFKSNSGLMTTDSDKQTIKIYELQDRIAATIALFEGVKDAKVNIALGEEQKYALADEKDKEKTASATATVIMKDNGSPTSEQATAIQRLVSRSIPEMVFENVSVFDGNGKEISVDTSDSSAASGEEGTELSQLIEGQIEGKVMNVLEPIYGTGNVRVSAKSKINMEKLVRETTEYSTPEKIDRNDKTGIIEKESGTGENSTGGTTTGGVAGTDANADVPGVNTDGTNTGETYESDSFDREYLVNQIKEQGQVNPGVLEDLTVSVAINGKDFGDLKIQELQSVIGNAAGIEAQEQRTKIAVVSSPFYQMEEAKTVASKDLFLYAKEYMIPIIAGVVLLIALLVTFIILGKRRKKRKAAALGSPIIKESHIELERQREVNDEIINLQNEKGMELKQNIRDFAEENPEISAQLLKNWLNGGGQNGDA